MERGRPLTPGTMTLSTKVDLPGQVSLDVRIFFCTEEGSYLRYMDFCFTRVQVQGTFRTCVESNKGEEDLTTSAARCPEAGTEKGAVQGYLTHKKQPPPLRTTIGPSV